MKLQATQENLNRALNNVARIASKRNALPILSNILIKTVGNRVCIAATNLNIAITHYIGSKVEQEGATTVPARLMQDFIASLPNGVIELKLEENKLYISTEQYKATINGIPADDYPVMPTIQDGKTWKMASSVLCQALQKVVVCASNDEARPVLTAVYFHTENNKLYITATDSYRLAEKHVIDLKQEVKLLVPAQSVHDLLRILSGNDEEVTITYDDQQVLFATKDIELTTRLIEGTYPDYKKLIPEAFTTEASLSNTEFSNITKVSSLFARESAGSVTIQVDKKAKEVSIRSIASQLGENKSAASAKITGEDGSITLNSRYIIDALGSLDGEQVLLRFSGKLDPCLITDTSDQSYRHVIMPLKS